MKKQIFFMLSTILLILSGCANTNNTDSKVKVESEKDEKVVKYSGSSFKIVVVGGEVLPKFENISYQKRDLQYLKTNTEEQFDALIITNSKFEEADKDKYVEFFNNVTYPVFFLGTENISLAAFTKKNTSLKQAKINQKAYAKGFINIGINTPDKKVEQWSFNLPDNPTNKDKNEKMLLRIFEKLEETKK